MTKIYYRDTGTDCRLNLRKSDLKQIGVTGRYQGVVISIDHHNGVITVRKAECSECGGPMVGTKRGGIKCQNHDRCSDRVLFSEQD